MKNSFQEKSKDAKIVALTEEIGRLKNKIENLEQNSSDLEIALETAVEHGDAVEDQLNSLNDKLLGEIKERVVAQRRLEKLIQAINQQKNDLELVVETITQHSDDLDNEWFLHLIEMEKQVKIDALTGIQNRRAMDEVLEKEFSRCKKMKKSLGFLMVDIDYFKQFNDQLGHQKGDECLKEIANIIHTTVEGTSDVVARYGGEEFAVILPESDHNRCKKVASDILEAITQNSLFHPKSPHGIITASIGIASMFPDNTSSVAEIIAQADKCLYSAKRSGRNKIMDE